MRVIQIFLIHTLTLYKEVCAHQSEVKRLDNYKWLI